MRFGVHTSLWQERWDEDVTPHIERAAALGFDGAEISLFTLRARDVRAVRRRLESLGLAITCSTGLGPDTDISSEDSTVRNAGLAQLRGDILLAAEAGSTLLCGVLYAAWGRVRYEAPMEVVRARSLEGLRQAAETARQAGVTLGLEVLNRYETSVLNTAAEARGLTDAVGRPHVGVHLDTYHMNIEEPDMTAAIRTAGARLVHVHCARGDRGAPGPGPMPWDRMAGALRDVGYDGWLVMECAPRAGTAVAGSYCVWRDLGPPDRIASEGLAFLRAVFSRR